MPNNPIVVFFKYDHLPKHLRPVSRWFATIAALVDQIPPGCLIAAHSPTNHDRSAP